MLIIFTLAQVASLITLVFPVAARYSVNLALAARLVLGWFCQVFFGLHGLSYCFSRFSVPKCKTISSQTSGTVSRNFQCKKASPWLSNFFLFWKLGGLVKKTPFIWENIEKGIIFLKKRVSSFISRRSGLTINDDNVDKVQALQKLQIFFGKIWLDGQMFQS